MTPHSTSGVSQLNEQRPLFIKSIIDIWSIDYYQIKRQNHLRFCLLSFSLDSHQNSPLTISALFVFAVNHDTEAVEYVLNTVGNGDDITTGKQQAHGFAVV